MSARNRQAALVGALRMAGLAGAALSLAACQGIVLHLAEPKFLKTGPNGSDTPGTFGAPFERVSIPSDERMLDGYLVREPAECTAHAAVLVFHGVMETISEWAAAQGFLRNHCVASLVFDYTGHGDSSPGGTGERVDRDAVAAYRYVANGFGPTMRLCVLGHSMGNGPMLEQLPEFRPAPACVVIANPLSSLRDRGAAHAPRFVVYLIPDMWNSAGNASRNESPLLIIHSRSDTVNPIEMGRRIFAAGGDRSR